jgi:DNA-directed RNA polymerase subunit RPC12/RpoP
VRVSDSVRDLLVYGIAAAKDGANDEARRYLEWALRLDPTHEQCIKARLWLSKISDDVAEKRAYLEQILLADPVHPEARRNLAILDGRLDPAEIVDPDNVPDAVPGVPQPAQARQFTCPHCGGRMVFSPAGASLICEYCAQHPRSEPLAGDGAIDEQDFVLALATAKGHTHPVATRCYNCQDCGASFVLGPERLSFRCPYCVSVYVAEQTEVRKLVPPEGVIPFVLTQDQARRAALEWLAAEELDTAAVISLSGVYLPMWTFDIDVAWKRRRHLEDDVLTPASNTLPQELASAVSSFHLDKLVPYDPGYLADWPAETYDVSVADASIKARAKARKLVAERLGKRIEDFGPGVARLSVMSFKLIIVPLWIVRYRHEERRYTVLVNGQTGVIQGERPSRGILGWLSRLAESN